MQMPISSPENNDPSISAQEKSMLPEWHMKKWSMSVLLKTNQNFLK